jgi:hypothetical protein
MQYLGVPNNSGAWQVAHLLVTLAVFAAALRTGSRELGIVGALSLVVFAAAVPGAPIGVGSRRSATGVITSREGQRMSGKQGYGRPAGVVASLLVLLAIFAGVAMAAQPKPGHYLWLYQGGASVNFDVAGKPPKIKNFSFSSVACREGTSVNLEKKGRVKSDGSFDFSGVGHDSDKRAYDVTVKGTFVSKTKAEGTVSVVAVTGKGCAVHKQEFTAKRQ